ncbi:hypothetical protein Psi01_33970 [Planobispora siamensis]|uniref:Uncharacterized protein n=2 Tax=Planobispora siamensis TaxID=936338 RepID=A0A8J3SE91_9ACTN|nr:hypothetical protein Psi01_33970 [Planobispora siamensis]
MIKETDSMRTSLKSALVALCVLTASAAFSQPAAAETYHTCRPDLWSGKCASGHTPARADLHRVWIGIEANTHIARWEVWDRETGARVGSGEVRPNQSFRTGIYGLYGSKYQLTIKADWGTYGFICDC